ncbi:FAD/NAD(P)-binding domain-containing protein [Basidiobolus meristosporus CBS 931.73]|uniref:FAD/NAD(P)-binding domain-containing protein n=1 Tax=Basidiobolus meristosporus CBS 931.73 TaxID=1314790 RepID=A0A1Y1YEV0_9FUNG|nr:FAD/NAD(P)-binding domain-containing protein [Basidiobolus meristosporus CBS 931.73]|eukprot:ORX96453.1 FAD/NAD(P)-binding domain-containing protein [Basidiobolus meristosporus CBS 931.73]
MHFRPGSFLLCLLVGGICSANSGTRETRKIGIIGAGIGGTSTAYYLRELLQKQNIHVDITIFEAEDRLGGRTLSPVFTRPKRPSIPLSMGASLFVSCNYNLMNLTKRFSLPVQQEFGEQLENSTSDLWNGREFLWKGSPVARYGPENFEKLEGVISSMLSRFLRVYDHDLMWTSVNGLFKSLGLDDMLGVTGYDYFIQQGLNETFVKEHLDFATRSNYARGITEIHALAASIATIPVAGACTTHSITSGNAGLSKELAARSRSKVLLKRRVKAIFRRRGKYVVVPSKGKPQAFDYLVIATPIHLSGLSFAPNIQYPSVNYTQVQVTHVTGRVKPAYFNVADGLLPTDISVTSPPGAKLPFNSLYRLANYQPEKGIYMYHLQTTGSLQPATLTHLFESLKKEVVQVTWNAYPTMTTTGVQQEFPVELSPGLYYLNTMEPFISTMETETLSARNIARLIGKRIRRSLVHRTQ